MGRPAQRRMIADSAADPRHFFRMSFLLSFLFHLLFLTLFQNSSLVQWGPKDYRIYQVEFIRPPVHDLDTILNESSGDIEQTSDRDQEKQQAVEHEIPAPDDQDTISLDTQDERYADYAKHIKDRLMQNWGYPPEARKNLIEGKLQLLFIINREGEVIKNQITTASGYKILDSEALKAVENSSPFAPFPSKMVVKRLQIKVDFDYRIASKHRAERKDP
jgi:TonB family protein